MRESCSNSRIESAMSGRKVCSGKRFRETRNKKTFTKKRIRIKRNVRSSRAKKSKKLRKKRPNKKNKTGNKKPKRSNGLFIELRESGKGPRRRMVGKGKRCPKSTIRYEQT